MDKFQAIDSFWSSFGLPAYDENTVPTGEDKPEFPYITYEASVSNLGYPVALSGSLWYYGPSWDSITAKLTEIQNELGMGGKVIPCDGGALWLKQGSPFAQRMADPTDMVRRIYMNIEAEFLTAN